MTALSNAQDGLQSAVDGVVTGDVMQEANYYRDSIIPAMNELRTAADALETIVDEKEWPFPTYGKMLFYV